MYNSMFMAHLPQFNITKFIIYIFNLFYYYMSFKNSGKIFAYFYWFIYPIRIYKNIKNKIIKM